ncbi:MAG TPA: SDR family oxidoreductase [Chloroflexota bacterium]|nr:SDR family oxidoreductase [Chloroflexota bacterium]
MDLGIGGKTALVCGASKGIGQATALALGREGARLAICARDQAVLETTAADLRATTGAEVLAIAADLRDGAAIEWLVRETAARYGGLDILVNNTGGPPAGPFEKHDDAAWQAAFETLLLSVVRLTRLAVPHMRRGQWGRIVTVTSTSVKQPITNLVLSNSLRAAVTGLCKTLATELAPDGITVNTVAPGRILTDRLTSLYGGDEATTRRTAAAGIPLGRVGEPLDMGRAIAYLCSEHANYITGVTLQVDGGLTSGLF